MRGEVEVDSFQLKSLEAMARVTSDERQEWKWGDTYHTFNKDLCFHDRIMIFTNYLVGNSEMNKSYAWTSTSSYFSKLRSSILKEVCMVRLRENKGGEDKSIQGAQF